MKQISTPRGAHLGDHPSSSDYSDWQSTINAGQRQAAVWHRPVLVSYTERLPRGSALAVFESAQGLGEANVFYWERPAEGYAMVGIGEAATRTSGSISEMSSYWRTLIEGALIHFPSTGKTSVAPPVAGPVCFAGFAFDADAPRTELWHGFPSGLLLLPAILFGTAGSDAYLTLNVVVSPPEPADGGSDDLQNRLAHIETLRRRLVDVWAQSAGPVPPPRRRERLVLRDKEPPGDWKRMVLAGTSGIREGSYRKVVLARSVEARSPEPFAISAALAYLGRRYADAYVFALVREGSTFLGASPERLARVADGQVETMALAGTEPRGTSPLEDRLLGEELLRQDKLQNEHAVVAEMIRSALAPLTRTLNLPSPPRLLKLHNVQHLMTPISGTLHDDLSVLQVVAALHPTPAVAGEPKAPALEAIRRLEHLDRGWYAGPIGLIAADGSGEFAVALRSALVADRCATLFAGCGIVDGSDPDQEYDESIWKLQVMLESLGGED